MGLLDGQVCIVSGAGQGLGRAIALEMAAEGASVVLLERNVETVESGGGRDRRGGRHRASPMSSTSRTTTPMARSSPM